MDVKVFPSLTTLNQDAKNRYHIDMFYDEDQLAQAPIITFITEQDQHIRDPEELGLSGGQLVKTAFGNLAAIEVPLQDSGPNESRLLYADNKKHAAEKILDRTFLQTAAVELGATEIMVAIPVRDAILICNAQSSEGVALLQQKLNTLFSDFSRSQLSRTIFRIQEGNIIGSETASNDSPLPTLEEKYPEGYEQRVSKLRLFEETYNMKLLVAAPEVDTFLNGVFVSLVMVIQEHAGKKHFNGTIEIHAEAKKPLKNETAIAAVKDFFGNLPSNPFVKAALRKGQQKVKISFLFGEDFQKGDVHKKIVTHLSH